MFLYGGYRSTTVKPLVKTVAKATSRGKVLSKWLVSLVITHKSHDYVCFLGYNQAYYPPTKHPAPLSKLYS